MLGFGKRKERKEMKKEMKQNKKDQKALEALAKCRGKVEPKVVKRVSKQLDRNEAIEGVVSFGSSNFYIVKTSKERYFVSGIVVGFSGLTKAVLGREDILGLVNISGAFVLSTTVGKIRITTEVLHPTMQDALYEEIQNLFKKGI